MIDLTNYAEKLGLKIKDKLYVEGFDKEYFGKIFRHFTLKQTKDFYNCKTMSPASDIILDVYEDYKNPKPLYGKVVDGKIIWDR